MGWTYKTLRAAIAALPAGTADPVAALNAQMVAVNINTADIFKILAPSGESFAIDRAGKAPVSGATPPTPADQIIGAAWSFGNILGRFQLIETGDPRVWASCQSAMAALSAAGLLSSLSIAAIAALRNAPAWDPPVIAANVTVAQAPNPWHYTVRTAVADPSNGNVVATVDFTNSTTGAVVTRTTWGSPLRDADIAAWAGAVVNDFLDRDASIAGLTIGTVAAVG